MACSLATFARRWLGTDLQYTLNAMIMAQQVEQYLQTLKSSEVRIPLSAKFHLQIVNLKRKYKNIGKRRKFKISAFIELVSISLIFSSYHPNH